MVRLTLLSIFVHGLDNSSTRFLHHYLRPSLWTKQTKGRKTGLSSANKLCLPDTRLSLARLHNAGSEGKTTQVNESLAEGVHKAEMEVKKSRFIAYAVHTETWPAAKDFLDNRVKTEHPKARHWCYGACLGVDPVNERCSDDGEPTGTAGQPILQALRTEGISDVMCVVVRYFGGVKLGTGGLIRAYGAAARNVLREAPRLECIPQSVLRVQVEVSDTGTLYEMVGKVQGECFDESYGDDGMVTASLICETSVLAFLKESLRDATKGSVKFLDPA